MSADNEIAVVKFPDKVRVAQVYGCPSVNDTNFIKTHYDEFQKNEFLSLAQAEEFAENWLADLEKSGIVEYGITYYAVEFNLEHYK